jgi:hypothetical protein
MPQRKASSASPSACSLRMLQTAVFPKTISANTQRLSMLVRFEKL